MMLTRNFAALDTTTGTLDSGWFALGDFPTWTLTISALETGASVAIYVTNKPAPVVGDVGSLLATVAAGTNRSYIAPGIFTWVRLIKTNGGTPAPSIAYLFAQSK